MPTPTLVPLITVPLIGWMMYRRIRRQFGRQPLSMKPIVIRLVILGIATAVVSVLAFAQPELLVPLAGGLLCGLLIAGANLRLTRFEWTPTGDYYYPHPYIGAALSLLLVARLAYRYYVLAGVTGNQPPPAMGQSPLTMGLLTLLLGYYVAYSSGLLILRHRHHRVGP